MPDELVLTIDIAAAPATVFRFLSEPELFRQWMGPGAQLSSTGVVVQYPTGDAARGTLRESVPGRRIVFGWGYDSGAHGLAPDATTVTIELEPTAGGTRVVLRHAGLDAPRQSEHRKGWTHYLAQLAAGATNLFYAETLPRVVEGYIAAWNESDASRRQTLLAACWEEDALFRDSMGAADGRDGLDRYIAAAQQFVPGYRLELDGAPQQCHGYYRFHWTIRMPDGSAMMRGANFGQLSPGGRISSAIGFANAK